MPDRPAYGMCHYPGHQPPVPPRHGERCTETNRALGLRCDRPAGHDGAHVQDDGTHVQGWLSEQYRPWWRRITPPWQRKEVTDA